LGRGKDKGGGKGNRRGDEGREREKEGGGV